MKVAFLTNIISPYRRPVFERLAATPGWDFRVIVNAQNEFDRAWSVDTDGLDVVQSKSWSIRRRVVSKVPIEFEQIIELHLPVGLWGDLSRFRPDAVISCELGPRSIVAAMYCRTHRIPLLLWAYQSRVSATQGGRRLRLRKWLLKQATVAIGMGTQAREVLRVWGAPDEKIMDALNSADQEGILRRLHEPGTKQRSAQIKQQWGDQRRLAIVVGRLVPLKGTAAMLKIWGALPDRLRAQWRLAFLGSGPLDKLIHQSGLPGVEAVGNVPTDELAHWYAAADLHIFPTLGDVWGLVVNEAMACGVPTLCSIHAGCSDDMIRHGENGLLFDPTITEQAADSLREALEQADLPTLGHVGQETTKRFTLDNLANSFRNAVAAATGPPAQATPPSPARSEAA